MPDAPGWMQTVLSNVRLKGGLAKTICWVLISFIGGIVAIAFVPNMIVAFVGMGVMLLLVFVVLMRLLNLANRNPAAALLGGADFLKWGQMESSKGNPPIPLIGEDIVESGKPSLTAEERRSLNKPDEEGTPPAKVDRTKEGRR